jgi:hypothetical protein
MSKKLITPVSILSYPNLFEPRAFGGGEPKYSAAIVMDASETTELKKAIAAVATERFGDKAKAVLQANPPIHDEAKATLKGYPEGHVYVNAKSTRQPQVVTRYADPATGRPSPISEDAATTPDGKDELYPGVKVKAYISVYAYDTNGNRGVAFGLEGLQRWDEGERLDGRTSVINVFEGEMPAEADLTDIMEDEEEDPLADIL